MRDKKSLKKHFTLVFCAYTFILWHKLTGGLRRRWANKPLNTFTEALEAFRTAMSFRFFNWVNENREVFAVKGIKLYQENHQPVISTYDVTHAMANLLKKELWIIFCISVNTEICQSVF